MSNIHHVCECLVLRTPPRDPVRRSVVLNVIALLLEALGEAFEMRHRAHQKYPFREE
jgi:hypothetical protein